MGAATITPEQVHDALNGAFLALWELRGESRAKIAWDTEDFDTSKVDDFVRFGFQHNLGEHAALGSGSSRFLRRFGIISAVVYVRKGEQAARRLALTEIVLEFLETVDVAGVSVQNPAADELGLVDGWNQVNCTADGHYDLTRTA
ncbi:MAG: hypothetical protein KAI80_09430 [Hyphomicrobiaceae bacterium]|nr:hypothetical protein [Hyphomicrobiaceae bacterium]